MDVKKYLQQKAEEDFSAELTESEREYYKTLSQRAAARHKHDYKFIVSMSCAAVMLLAVIIMLCVVYIPNWNPLKYSEEKIVSKEATVEDIKSDAKFFDISLIESENTEMLLYYDSESGDKLYYRIVFSDVFENSAFTLVINNNYKYNFDELTEVDTKVFADYSVLFEKTETQGGTEGLLKADYKGYITLQTETVYFTYSQYPSLGDDFFYDYIQQVVHKK